MTLTAALLTGTLLLTCGLLLGVLLLALARAVHQLVDVLALLHRHLAAALVVVLQVVEERLGRSSGQEQ